MRHVWSAPTQEEFAHMPGAVCANNLCSLSGNQTQQACEVAGRDWTSNKSSSLFLRNALEILDDHKGNENGLCESNETCLFTPNLGSYQGHGHLETAAVIGQGTALENITPVQHSANGRRLFRRWFKDAHYRFLKG